jgi:hypothetical protein
MNKYQLSRNNLPQIPINDDYRDKIFSLASSHELAELEDFITTNSISLKLKNDKNETITHALLKGESTTPENELLRCMKFLVERGAPISNIDKEYFKEYLDFQRVGPVNEIRVEVANYLIDNDITSVVLDEIIKKHKKEKPLQLRAWLNPYKILHPFINQEYKHFDEKIEKFTKEKFSNQKPDLMFRDETYLQGNLE